ncbi:hypothetical protein RJT34_23630 [Clitoria ternatea]|uniref:Disease resistance protein n=1 Tax=Clitoria ternatea TaxID=43366 RepID=A0AAN9FV10_CLITE
MGVEEEVEFHPKEPHRSIKGIANKVQSLREEKQLMDTLFQEVQEIGKLDRISKTWVGQMEDIARETEYVINKYETKLENKPTYVRMQNLVIEIILKMKTKEIRRSLEDASRRRKSFGLVQSLFRAESSLSKARILHRSMQPSLAVKQSSVVGFNEDVEVLIAKLLSDEEHRSFISIVGIEGTGKTTLARLIFDNNAVALHFRCRIWVSMCPNYTAQLLIDQVAKEAAKQMMEGQHDDVLRTLASTRYLIVVDGVETPQVVFDALKKTIPDMSTGCRLVLTSRHSKEEQYAGTRPFVHPLHLLDDKNSWMLFTKKLKVEVPTELTDIGEKIVVKCGGLPSQISEISDLLLDKGVTREEWSSVLEELNQDPQPWLVALWVAKGLVRQGEDEKPPEQVAERYLTELIDANIVQIAKRKRNGKANTCRLPHALRQLWLKNANQSSQANAEREKSIIRQVADHLDNNDIWHNHIHPHCRSTSVSLTNLYKDVLLFISFDSQEGNKPGQEVGSFLKLCISSNCLLQLRVLDLECVYKPKLPENIARLSRLRYLGLRWTYLDSLPSSISSLFKLQTLDLKHTYIHTLTSSIWKMQLRHLFLSETYRTRFPPQPMINSLSNLQTLWGLFVDEETPVRGGLDRLVQVRKLGLACQSMSLEPRKMQEQLDAVADWIMKLEFLQSLKLKSRDEQGRPWNLHLKSFGIHMKLTDMYLLGTLSTPSQLQFPPSLVELTLSHSKLKDDPMQILKDLPNLRSLSLLAESYMGTVMVCDFQSFPQLHVLRVWKLEQLEEWIIEQEALPSLRQLEIRMCPSLKMLPQGLEHVNTLLELKLTNMPLEINTENHNIPPYCEVYRDL